MSDLRERIEQELIDFYMFNTDNFESPHGKTYTANRIIDLVRKENN